jgi:hypothetical protein
MKQFPTRAASNIVAGVILAMLGTIIWAATMMTARDWLCFGIFVASAIGLVYFREWTGCLFGISRRLRRERRETSPSQTSSPSREPYRKPDSGRPLILSLHDSGAITNGRPAHHHNKQKL